MSYFKTSFATLQDIAQAGRFEDVAGFLVLARHASGLSIAGFDAYKLSGAGINSIHEKAGVSEETARGVIERLKDKGVIQPTTPDVRKKFIHGRWEILQGDLDLELPHALIDRLKGSEATPPLRRMRDAGIAAAHRADGLQDVSASELRLDALMLLLSVYRNTDMESFGGLDPRCAHRKWDVKSQTDQPRGIRWGAEPDEDSSAVAYTSFMTECLRHTRKFGPKGQLTEQQKHRFWNAWDNLRTAGLIYEAVALFDAPPASNQNARLICSLRINDFYAGSATRSGDPSLLRTMEEGYGTELAYYTPSENMRGEPEAMWVILPERRGALVGIWRVRYRAATQNVGAWIDKENEAIEHTLDRLASSVE